MRSNKFDKDDAVVVIHVHDQSILVSADIENHAVVGDKARMPSENRAGGEKKAMKRGSAPKPPLRIVVTPPNFVKRNFAAATWSNEATDG